MRQKVMAVNRLLASKGLMESHIQFCHVFIQQNHLVMDRADGVGSGVMGAVSI